MTDAQFAADARRELVDNILPFWRRNSIDHRRGGFIGEMANDLRVREDATRGLILNARVLWTFAAAYRDTHEQVDAALAQRAYDYFTTRFLDPQHGGCYWDLESSGDPRDRVKRMYGQAFGIYALSEYHRTFDHAPALRQALDIFRLIEAHARDPGHGGYVETLSREWKPIGDMRLSPGDMNAPKSMNTHLHLMEAYTNLLRVWPDDLLMTRLRGLVDVFLVRILNTEGTHLHHFFDMEWKPLSDNYTFGHDIEASWLLCEAAGVLGDARLQARVRDAALKLARVSLQEGLDRDGGLVYEGRAGRIVNAGRDWWPQAEAVVGFYNAFQLTREAAFREAAINGWRFIRERVVDKRHGEWFWRVRPDGTPDAAQPKVSAWKGPYHNGRCCLELAHRAGMLSSQEATHDR